MRRIPPCQVYPYAEGPRLCFWPLPYGLLLHVQKGQERLRPLTKGLDVMPLGAGAIAGSTLPLDRDFIRERLGFKEVSQNSMDAVSDRDFVIVMVFCVAMVMLHLSRLSEDLIIFSTEEFSFIALPDMVCTGSSLMPHKKNPDALELIRGKAASVISDLFTLFVIMKGLPMTYNRDMQEDKRPLFHSMDTLKDSLGVITLCIKGMSINRERLSHVVYQGFISATEMAEYLTKKGMAFREAHHLIGRVVRECEEKGISFKDLGLDELKRYSPLFDEGVFDSIDPYHILENRKVEGAGSIDEVERALKGRGCILVLSILSLSLVMACGKKGDPMPIHRVVPARITDLNGEVRDGMLFYPLQCLLEISVAQI